MASTDGSILIRTNVDTTGIKKGTTAIRSGIKGINSSLLKLGATIGLVFGVGQLVKFGKEAVKLSSDLTEVQNVVDVAFGEMAYKIEQFADSSIENFGISELSAKTMASTFMAMANGMKQGLEVASDMSVEITGRLADIMSFYNKSMSEVETIGRAVFSGETEPLKQIGVIMTEAQLQTFALANGYTTLYKNMDAANKLLIRQKYFLEVTNQAAGDFVRTQDSWANQTRILSERWKEFLTLVGGRLIQVLTPVVNILNNLLTVAINLGNAMATIFGWQVEQSNAAAATSGAVSDTADSEEDLADSTNDTTKALKKQLAYFDDINVLASETATSGVGTGTTTPSDGSAGGFTPIDSTKTIKELSDLEKKMLDMLNRIKEAWRTDADFTFLGEALGNAINDMLNRIDWDAIQETAYKIGKSFATFLNGAIKTIDWTLVGKTLAEGVNTMIILAQGFIENFDFKEFGLAIGKGINGFFKNVDWKQLFTNASNLAIGILDATIAALDEIDFTEIGEEIAEGLEEVEWSTIFENLGIAIGKAIGGSIDFLEGIKEAQKNLEENKGEFEKLIPDTVFEFLQFAGSSIGVDLGGFLNLQKGFEDFFPKKEDYNSTQEYLEAVQNIKTELSTMSGSKYKFPEIEYDESGFNTIFSGMSEKITNFVEFATQTISIGVNGIFTTVSNWWTTVIVPWWNNTIVNFFETYISPWFSAEKWFEIGQGILDGISTKWTELVTWWDENIVAWWDTYVAPWFTVERWQILGDNMKKGIINGFKAVVSGVVGVLNTIIDVAESMINKVIDGINEMIEKAKNLASIVGVDLKVKTLSPVNFKNIKVPELAQGGVIPPNKEFMAILGDQKSGTNIEAPLDTIKQALMEVLNNRGNLSTASGDLVIKVGDVELIRVLLPTILSEMTRQGYDTTVLGVS